MKENYKEEDMIAFGWVSLIVYLIGNRIAFAYDQPKLWLEFWRMNQVNGLGGYVLWLLFAKLITKDRGWKFFAFGEDSLINLLFINLIFFVISLQWKLIILTLLTCLIAWVFKDKYRSLSWYKSGKKGFLFLLANIIFFVGLSAITGNYYLLIISLLSVIGLVMLGHE
jgi:hypothetical protein